MSNSLICARCRKACKDPYKEPCEAIETLTKLYAELRTEEKTGITRNLRMELAVVDYEVAEDIKELGERIIKAMPELNIIRDYEVKIGYVRSYEAKRDKGKQINADCRKVNGTYTAYLPFDFIVTFYEPNIYYMTENQKKILMLHELKHIGIGDKGLKIEEHDIEDFKTIMERFGLEWNDFGQDAPDILKGENYGEKPKGKRKKKQGLGT